MKNAKFIWISKSIYPYLQKSSISVFSADRKKYRFGVAAFKKGFVFEKKIKTAEIEVFGDTRYYLWQNKSFVGTGPCPTCGDFNMPIQYSDRYIVDMDSYEIDFYARVQLTPTAEFDNSKGRGGFIMEASLTFEDGSVTAVYTEETGLARQEKEFLSPLYMDYTRKRDDWSNAVLVKSIWHVEKSQIKGLREEVVSKEKFVIPPKTEKEFKVNLDKIYSAYSALDINSKGEYVIELITSEVNDVSKRKHWIKGNGCEKYRSNEYFGVGEYNLTVYNRSDNEIKITSDVIFVCYPSEDRGYFKCSDEILNSIYELGKWTVKICRQSLELDSPVHQENLLCTGDYIIESLVNNYTTGDYSLTRFDILRMGHYLDTTEGYMYIANYALLWVEWLYEYYLYSGDTKIFDECKAGLESVLQRFSDAENGDELLSELNGYAFVDWAFVDGYSMFSPPRALGEAATNAFYCNMIVKASKIYSIMGDKIKSNYYKNKAGRIKNAFNNTFFDIEKGIYFDGLNEPSASDDWAPENPEKRYYTRYSNILAVLFCICEKSKSKEILEWVLKPENLEGIQPYFMHYLLEAIYENDLFGKYGTDLIKKWKRLTDECDKGIHEVWHEFEGYNTDYSHGWGATPTYQLPSKILGIRIIEAGFKKIQLKPNLYGLKWADIIVPTPYGDIECHIESGNTAEIKIPDCIEAEIL